MISELLAPLGVGVDGDTGLVSFIFGSLIIVFMLSFFMLMILGALLFLICSTIGLFLSFWQIYVLCLAVCSLALLPCRGVISDLFAWVRRVSVRVSSSFLSWVSFFFAAVATNRWLTDPGRSPPESALVFFPYYSIPLRICPSSGDED